MCGYISFIKAVGKFINFQNLVFIRVILEHAKGIERGSGGTPQRYDGGHSSYSNSVSGRKQRAREK